MTWAWKLATRCSLFITLTCGAGAHAYKGKLERGDWLAGWNQKLDEILSSSTLIQHNERQIEKLCPGYKKSLSKRKIFWRQLLISLSWKESIHGPENYVEFRGGTNDGLFQINPILRSAYGCADFNLFDPHQNMTCAVKMTEKLVKRFGTFLDGAKGGMAAYWQPLRATSAYNRKNRAFILSAVKEACRTNEVAYHCHATLAPHVFEGAGEVDLTYNTIDDLGLTEKDLETPHQMRNIKRKPATFEMDPASGMLFDLEEVF